MSARFGIASGLLAATRSDMLDPISSDTVHADGPRVPADEIEGLDGPFDGNYVNPEDATNGKHAQDRLVATNLL